MLNYQQDQFGFAQMDFVARFAISLEYRKKKKEKNANPSVSDKSNAN